MAASSKHAADKAKAIHNVPPYRSNDESCFAGAATGRATALSANRPENGVAVDAAGVAACTDATDSVDAADATGATDSTGAMDAGGAVDWAGAIPPTAASASPSSGVTEIFQSAWSAG